MQKRKQKAPRGGGAQYFEHCKKLYGADYSTPDAATIADALGFKKVGKSWKGRCWVHDDRNPSAVISESDTGLPLVYCFAGCSQEALIDGLRDRGLWRTVRPEIAEQRKRDRAAADLRHRLDTVRMLAEADRAAGRDSDWSEADRDLARIADHAAGGGDDE